MKNKILAVCVILICVSITATGTLTYFTSESTAHNVVTTGSVQLELKEIFPEKGISGVLPESSVDKVVWVENIGTVPAWVRVSASLTAHSKSGEQLPTALADGSPLIRCELLPGWVRGEDGFYYYETILQPGEKTSNMMTKVVLDARMGNEYQESRIDLDLTAYGVQSGHNGSTVMQAKGWPEPAADN